MRRLYQKLTFESIIFSKYNIIHIEIYLDLYYNTSKIIRGLIGAIAVSMNIKKPVLIMLLFFVFLGFRVNAEEKTISLKDCLIYALGNNPDIKSYNFKVNASYSQLHQAISDYLPSISGSSTYDRSGSQTTAMTKSFGDTLKISQLVYDFNKTNYSIKMAGESLKQSDYSLYLKIQDIISSVIGAYYDVLKNIHLVEALKRDVARREKTLEQAKAFFEVGVKSKIDVTTSRVNLSTARLDLIKARNDLKVSYQSLYKAMGFNEGYNLNPEDIKYIVEYNKTRDEALAISFNERRDLMSLGSKIESSEIQAKYNQRGTYPYVTADGSYTWNGSQYPLNRSWDLGLNLNWSIFDAGLSFWKVKESNANIQDFKAQYESLKNSIKKEVSDYYSELIESFEAIKVSKEKLQNANENMELAEGRYNVGQGDIIELSQAQYEQIQADADMIVSVYTYMKAKADLEKATGVDMAPIYVKN